MNNQLENIIKYLDNEMSEIERLDFENQMRKDDVLAKEVAFQRGLHGFLEREKLNLEQKLSDLGDEFIINPNKDTKKGGLPIWLIGLLGFVVVAVVFYFIFFSKNNSNTFDNDNSTKTEEVIPNNTIKNVPNETIDTTVNEIINPIEPPTFRKEKTPKDNNQPIASVDEKVFERNAIMEEVITETYRENKPKDFTTVTIPKQDEIFNYTNSIPFKVVGNSTVDTDFQLIIYSNRDFDINNDYKILDTKIDRKFVDNQYQFNFNGNLSLKKGLYYLVIRKNGTREVLHISRFTVK